MRAAAPQPDIPINNVGGPPPGEFRSVERDAWISAVGANMLTPIFLIRETIDGMIARGASVIPTNSVRHVPSCAASLAI